VSEERADIDIHPLEGDDDHIVDRLWQLYVHDLSQLRGSLPNEQGLFKIGHLQWFRDEPDNWKGFLVRFHGLPVGFAYVGINWRGDRRTIGEFFIVRGARRRGAGEFVARTLIGRYPGAWEIAFQDDNHGATVLDEGRVGHRRRGVARGVAPCAQQAGDRARPLADVRHARAFRARGAYQ